MILSEQLICANHTRNNLFHPDLHRAHILMHRVGTCIEKKIDL